MIVTELLNEGTLIKHYSDEGMMLLQEETSILYTEAIDVVPCQYNYTETDISIESDEEEVSKEDLCEIIDILTGETD